MALILPKYVYDAGAGAVTINFTEPLADDDIFNPKAKIREAKGGTGIRQRQKDFIEEKLTIHHKYVPEAELNSVITMMKDWVLGGGHFDFYPDQTAGPFTSVEFMGDEFEFDRMFTNVARFEFKVPVRKRIT